MKFCVSFLLLAFSFTNDSISAQEIPTQDGLFTTAVYKITDTGDSLKLDIFQPENFMEGRKNPVVMVIHGGGWAEGDRGLNAFYYMQRLRQQLNQKGFVVISIDYSLVSKTVHFPTPVIDCRDAIRWVRANGKFWSFDTSNISLCGGAAGAHLAMLSAVNDDTRWIGDPKLASFSARVNCVSDNFGPTDLNGLLRTDGGKFSLFLFRLIAGKLFDIRERLIYALTGYSITSEKDSVISVANMYSPLNYIDSSFVPTLIFHGTKDKVVPIKQSKSLYSLLKERNVPAEFLKVKGGDHGFNNISRDETHKLVDKTVKFFIDNLEIRNTVVSEE